MPSSGVKIQYGNRTLDGSVLERVSINLSLNPISEEIAINTANIVMRSGITINKTTPLEIMLHDNLVLKAFAKDISKENALSIRVTAEDYIGKLADAHFDGYMFHGGREQSQDDRATTAILDVFTAAGLQNNYAIDSDLETELESTLLDGVINPCDCRDALLQIAFACRFCVTTFGQRSVRLFRLSNNAEPTVIDAERCRQDGAIEAPQYEATAITFHRFSPGATNVYALDKSTTSIIDAYGERVSVLLGDTAMSEAQFKYLTETNDEEVKKDGSVKLFFDAPYYLDVVVVGTTDRNTGQPHIDEVTAFSLSASNFLSLDDGSPIPDFDENASYEGRRSNYKGDFVKYDGEYYHFVHDKSPGAWDPTLVETAWFKGLRVRGKPYIDTNVQLKKGSSTEKVAQVADATLVNESNVLSVLNTAHEFYTAETMSVTVVDRAHGSGGYPIKYGDGYIYGEPDPNNPTQGIKYGSFSPYIVTYDAPVNIGDRVKLPTENEDVFFVGRVIQSTFELKSGVIEKQIVVSGETQEQEESEE